MKPHFFCITCLLFIQTVWPADLKLIKTDKYVDQPQKLNRIRVASVSVLPDRWQKRFDNRRPALYHELYAPKDSVGNR